MMTGYTRRYTAFFSLILFALVLAGCAPSYTTIRQHPEFATNQRAITKVAILVPKAEVELITFTGENERLSDQESTASAVLVETAVDMLSSRGYQATAFAPGEETGGDELRFEVENIREAVNKVSSQTYQSRSMSIEEAGKVKATVGPMVNRVADSAEADALLVINYYAFEKSKGQQAKDILAASVFGALTGVVSVPAAAGSSVHVSLLDGTTGDVLWSNLAASAGQNPGIQCQSAMLHLPKVSGEAFVEGDPLRQIKEKESAVAEQSEGGQPQVTAEADY